MINNTLYGCGNKQSHDNVKSVEKRIPKERFYPHITFKMTCE